LTGFPVNDPGPYYRPPGMPYANRPRRTHWLPIIIGVVFAGVALLLLLVLFYPTAFGLSQPSYPYRYPFGGFFILFFVVIVLFFVVRVAFWSVRWGGYGRRSGGGYSGGQYGPNRPAMIARMRYARGEISREQYDQIMKDLGRPPNSP